MTERVDERAFVREQDETEDRLRARKSAYANAEGDDPREFAFQAIAEANPRRVLEVGGGEGELAERVVNELGAEVVGVDQSSAWSRSSVPRGSTRASATSGGCPSATASSMSP